MFKVHSKYLASGLALDVILIPAYDVFFVYSILENANYSMLFAPAALIILHTIMFYIMNNESILKIFGRNVQKYRKERQLSQEKLAELARVHRTYIGMIERAEKNITLCNIEKIAIALEVEIKDLLER